MKNNYGFGKVVAYSFEEALEKVKNSLQQEGFGVLTEIDVAATMEKKLNKVMPPYIIYGACNPPFAHRALELDASMGLLLPCNVIIRQDEDHKVHVGLMDPYAVLTLLDKPEVKLLAEEVKKKLERVMESL